MQYFILLAYFSKLYQDILFLKICPKPTSIGTMLYIINYQIIAIYEKSVSIKIIETLSFIKRKIY